MHATLSGARSLPASSFVDALHSAGPAADRADKLKLYGWLIGSWTMDATVYRDNGTRHQGAGAIHFGWALEGRAIQDVWILPGVFYGTTLRIYDPGIDAWHILWSDPVRQVYTRQIGRAQGADIVQHGKNDAGEACAGVLRKSRPARFAGPANARATTARPGSSRPGSCRPSSSPGARRDYDRLT